MNPIENLKDLIIYQSQNNDNVSVEVLYDNEDFWLTQKSMSKLFEVEVNTINYHLKEIFKSSELTRANMFCSPFFQLALDGKSEENQGRTAASSPSLSDR